MANSPTITARRRTQAPVPAKKNKAKISEYDESVCEKCGSGEKAAELLLCDKCHKGFHLFCLRPILPSVPKGSWLCPNCSVQIQTKPKSFKGVHSQLKNLVRENIFEWQFAIRGPTETEFEGGIYHGRIQLPSEYPFKTPSCC